MSQYYVRKSITRSPDDRELAKRYAEFGVATVAEAQGKQGIMDHRIRPIQTDQAVAGRAVTVVTPAGDNLMIHAAIEVCQPGDILVVSSLAPSIHGAFGELLATACQKRGVAGVILDLGVRDTAAIRRMELPVWARAVYTGGTVKNSPGRVNGPIVCGGATVSPGDFIVADDDGVVVVASQDLESVRASAEKRVEKEQQTRRKIEAGELSVDFYNLRPLLSDLGVDYLE